jgi:AcrR family transcriptional regulator
LGLSLRKSQREATRQRVLDAARELFETDGYDETTVRAIARRAKVSVGSVFTGFASKAEILSQVMQERLEGLHAELDRVAPLLRGSTADRLRTLFALHIAFEAPRVRLYLAHIVAAYSWTPQSKAQPYGHNRRLVALIRDTLAEGVANGDVDREVDLDALVDLVIAAYAWTYRLASWEQADAAALTAAMDRQIGTILRGCSVRAA